MKKKHSGALIIVPVLSIVISFLIGCIIIAALGASPADAMQYLWKGAFGNVRNLGTTFSRATPLIFTTLCSIPAIFVAFTSVSPETAGYVALFYIIYYTIDSHVLQPEIMGRNLNLHPVIVLLALLIGGKLFGIFGMLIATPVAAVYRVLYDELWYYDGEEEEFRHRVVQERLAQKREQGIDPDSLTLEEEVAAEEDAFAETKAEKEERMRELTQMMEEEARKRAERVHKAREEAERAEGMGPQGGNYNDMP